jgi:hypothetical protein
VGIDGPLVVRRREDLEKHACNVSVVGLVRLQRNASMGMALGSVVIEWRAPSKRGKFLSFGCCCLQPISTSAKCALLVARVV